MTRIIPRILQNIFSGGLFSLIILSSSPSFCQNYPDSINVLHYDISLDQVDIPAKTINGHTTLKLTSNYRSVYKLHLDLLRLTVDSVLLGGFVHTYYYNDTVITLNLTIPLSFSDTLIVDVYYHGTPHVEASGWGGFHFYGNNLAYNLGIALHEIPHVFGKVWFACIDNFTERATYDFHICVNSSLFAVCNGILMSASPHPNGTMLYHWKLAQEIPAYLASVAISNYTPVQNSYCGLMMNIPTYIYVQPADSIKAKNSFIHLNAVLATFEGKFGPYRWPRVGYVSTTIGAMEHATNIAYPSASINGKLNDEYLYAHELSHSWFGDLITCKSPADMWINEGWAVFCESIAMEGLYGTTAYKNNIRTKLNDVLQNTHITDAGYRAVYGIPEQYTYGSTVYDKGGIVVHSLRGYLGDSIFFNTTKALLDSFAYHDISTIQMRDFFNTHARINVTDFFNAWVFAPGFLHFSVDSFQVSKQGTGYAVTVYIRQKLKGMLLAANSNRIEIGFLGNNWQYTTRLMQFSGSTGIQTFVLPFVPSVAMVDPEEKLGDATVDYGTVIKNVGTRTFPDTYFTLHTILVKDSAFVRVIHNWVAPDLYSQLIPGLTLSPFRYWKIEGLFPPGFKAGGDFFYSMFNNLDNELLKDDLDSLVMLYRPGVTSSWQGISFNQNGTTRQGILHVENILPGEYALAVWDHHFTGKDKLIHRNKLRHKK